MNRSILALAATLVVALAAATGAAAQTTGVVMSGLDNPRGLAVGPEGALYVAEAGRGGPGPCVTVRGAPQCYGPTGAVTRLWRGEQDRIATGLPSYASPAGEATGPHDIAFRGRGGAYVTLGLGLEGLRGRRSRVSVSSSSAGSCTFRPAAAGGRSPTSQRTSSRPIPAVVRSTATPTGCSPSRCPETPRTNASAASRSCP